MAVQIHLFRCTIDNKWSHILHSPIHMMQHRAKFSICLWICSLQLVLCHCKTTANGRILLYMAILPSISIAIRESIIVSAHVNWVALYGLQCNFWKMKARVHHNKINGFLFCSAKLLWAVRQFPPWIFSQKWFLRLKLHETPERGEMEGTMKCGYIWVGNYINSNRNQKGQALGSLAIFKSSCIYLFIIYFLENYQSKSDFLC